MAKEGVVFMSCMVLWLVAGTMWAFASSVPAQEPQPSNERIVIGGLAADQCGATPDAPVIAGDE